MAAPEIGIIVMAAVELLAVVAMGIAAFLMYRRAKQVAGWAQPVLRDSRAIARRGKSTLFETRDRTLAFVHVFQELVAHVSRKVQTTTRLAREVTNPSLAPLQEAARAVGGPDGVAARLARLHAAGKIAAGQDNGRGAHG